VRRLAYFLLRTCIFSNHPAKQITVKAGSRRSENRPQSAIDGSIKEVYGSLFGCASIARKLQCLGDRCKEEDRDRDASWRIPSRLPKQHHLQSERQGGERPRWTRVCGPPKDYWVLAAPACSIQDKCVFIPCIQKCKEVDRFAKEVARASYHAIVPNPKVSELYRVRRLHRLQSPCLSSRQGP